MEVKWCQATRAGIWGVMPCGGEMIRSGEACNGGQRWDIWRCFLCGVETREALPLAGISYDEVPPTQRAKAPDTTCRLCGRDGVRARECAALTCPRCGVWCFDDGCGVRHPLPDGDGPATERTRVRV